MEVQVFIDYLQLVRQLTVGRERRKEDYMQIKINDNLTENIKDISVSTGGGVFNLSELNTYLLNLLYPIGSVYLSVNSKSPATLFGGTWVQITDRFLYCTTTSKTTGGEATHTLTINEMPSHSHSFDKNNTSGNAYETLYQGGAGGVMGGITSGDNMNQGYTSIGNTGGGQAHNNMPPYFTVYCWYRTA